MVKEQYAYCVVAVLLISTLCLIVGLLFSKENPNTSAEELGARAARAGLSAESNPYEWGRQDEKVRWLEGYLKAKESEEI